MTGTGAPGDPTGAAGSSVVAGPEGAGGDLDRSTLGKLTATKAVANTALRWIPPFLPTLERAFGASTTQLTTAIGVGEFAGLSTLVFGRQLDRGRERTVMVAGLGAVSLSAVIALAGTVPAFAASFFVLIVGVSNFTVAGHAWISHRVDYRWRGRAIGLFETSWAFALLVGAPLIALLIDRFGWRGPFVAIAVAAAAAAVFVAVTLPARAPDGGVVHGDGGSNGPIPARAWLVVFGSALLALAGIAVFVVSGTWLDDAFGVPTAGLGAVAMTFGAVELVASTGTAAFADRIGKVRSALGGLAMLLLGLVVMLSAGDRVIVGVLGLLLFLLGFEYGFVTSLSIVSEAVPEARGRTLAMASAIGTFSRGGGTILSGYLYGIHGIAGSAAVAGAAALASLTCFLLSRTLAGARPTRRES